MLVRSVRRSIFPLATLALSSSLALSSPAPAQQPPAQAAPPSTAAPAPAPVERRPPSGPRMRLGMQGGMRPGGIQQRGNFRGGGMQQRGDFRGGFHGRPGEGFRGGARGPMGADFRIAPAGTWWKNPRVVQRLSLTADQTRKMDDIVQQSRLQLIDLRANLEKQQLLLEPMLGANPLDTAKVSAQIDKVAQARADLEKSDARMLLGIRAVLTPDQWTKLHERPAPAAAPAAGAPPAASGTSPGRWRGSRPGGPGGGNGMDNLVAPIDPQ